MIKHVPKGIEARRQHDPIELAKDYDRVAHERPTDGQGSFSDEQVRLYIPHEPEVHLEAGGVISGEQGKGATYTPPPERQTVLEVEIVKVLTTRLRSDAGPLTFEQACLRQARRILKIQRIAKALRLLEDHENGLVDLVYPGTRKD